MLGACAKHSPCGFEGDALHVTAPHGEGPLLAVNGRKNPFDSMDRQDVVLDTLGGLAYFPRLLVVVLSPRDARVSGDREAGVNPVRSRRCK